MKTLLLAAAAVLCLPTALIAASLESAIEAAVRSAESRVVQLRYFGDGGDSLGASAAPVTGYALDDGWVLTSLYALSDDPAAIVARYHDGSQASLTIAGRDHGRRLVLLRSEDAAAVPSISATRPPRVGETVVALGRVYGAEEVSLTSGIVSAIGRLGGRAIQTDAAVSPANYGGPLVALDGTLLGILAPLSPPGQSGVGLYDSGVGFAVPPGPIAERLGRLAAGEAIHSAWLGAAFADDDPLRSPARIVKVAADSPAESAGLAEGDTILALAGKPTPTVWTLRAVLGGLDAGVSLAATIETSDNARQEVTITPTKRPAGAAGKASPPSLQVPDLPTKKPGEP